MDGIVGEIRLFARNSAPRNWLFCDGTVLPVSPSLLLFNILGSTFGGDGNRTFVGRRLAAAPSARCRLCSRRGAGRANGRRRHYRLSARPRSCRTMTSAWLTIGWENVATRASTFVNLGPVIIRNPQRGTNIENLMVDTYQSSRHDPQRLRSAGQDTAAGLPWVAGEREVNRP
jgi:Phage Tail Collar Domain